MSLQAISHLVNEYSSVFQPSGKFSTCCSDRSIMCDSPSIRMLGSCILYTCISGGPIRMACNGGGNGGGSDDDGNDDPRTK
jgi:hypothetical protein